MPTEITTLHFSGPVPRPHAPCDRPTPDEQFRQSAGERQRQLDARERERQQRRAEQQSAEGNGNGNGGSGGSGNSVSKFFADAASTLRSVSEQAMLGVQRVSAEVSEKTEAQVRQVGKNMAKQRFTADFHDLAAMGEVLLSSYSCSVMHAAVKVPGHMYITNNYLCFSAALSSHLEKATNAVRDVFFSEHSKDPMEIRQVIPLTEVASIQLSVDLDTIDNGPPYFLLLPAPNVLPTSLQVFTTRQQLFQFFAFESLSSSAGAAISDALKSRSIDRAYNYLDHAWRAATDVPLKGVNYA